MDFSILNHAVYYYRLFYTVMLHSVELWSLWCRMFVSLDTRQVFCMQTEILIIQRSSLHDSCVYFQELEPLYLFTHFKGNTNPCQYRRRLSRLLIFILFV